MPDYTVTVTKNRVIKEDIEVTAANEAAAEAAAITIAMTYVFDDNSGITYTADATLVP